VLDATESTGRRLGEQHKPRSSIWHHLVDAIVWGAIAATVFWLLLGMPL